MDVNVEFSSGPDAWKRLMNAVSQFSSLEPMNTVVELSAPKSGTHLLRNILLGFVGAERYDNGPWFFGANLRNEAGEPELHLKPNSFRNLHASYEDFSKAVSTTNPPPYKTVLLIRNPAHILLSSARQVLNTSLDHRADFAFMRKNCTFDETLGHFTRGYKIERTHYSGLEADVTRMGVSWLPHADIVLRYEDLQSHVRTPDAPAAESYFTDIFKTLGIGVPENWRDRVTTMARGELSATFANAADRSKIDDDFNSKWLPVAEQLVQSICPDLPARLGYA